MVSNHNVLSFLKGNVGEEDVIKLLLLSATKALLSVLIFVGAIFSYIKLCNKFEFEFITLSIVLITCFSMWYCSRGLEEYLGVGNNEFRWYNYRSWKLSFHNLQFKKMLYVDATDKIFKVYWLYFESVIAGICLTITTFAFGYLVFHIYALVSSLDIYIGFPFESFLTIGYLLLSTIFMSALFLKLKWKKIKLTNGYNWNLVAWCVCAAVIITMISLVAGVAIRRIAGFIGIEYTAILVASYILITTVYVYLDLRQWIDKKERDRLAKEASEKKSLETMPTIS
jgi:hypothetical protein